MYNVGCSKLYVTANEANGAPAALLLSLTLQPSMSAKLEGMVTKIRGRSQNSHGLMSACN